MCCGCPLRTRSLARLLTAAREKASAHLHLALARHRVARLLCLHSSGEHTVALELHALDPRCLVQSRTCGTPIGQRARADWRYITKRIVFVGLLLAEAARRASDDAAQEGQEVAIRLLFISDCPVAMDVVRRIAVQKPRTRTRTSQGSAKVDERGGRVAGSQRAAKSSRSQRRSHKDGWRSEINAEGIRSAKEKQGKHFIALINVFSSISLHDQKTRSSR